MTAFWKPELLDLVFGPDFSGKTPEERARTSKVMFVRSQMQLAQDSPQATGRRMTAYEALKAYGTDALIEVAERGRFLLVSNRNEPATSIRAQMDALGIAKKSLAKTLGMREAEIAQIDVPGKLSSGRVLDRIAAALAMDEQFLGMDRAEKADADLGVRFKTLSAIGQPNRSLSPTVMATLLDAAWVVRKQSELSADLGLLSFGGLRFDPSSDYSSPAYSVGYRLAVKTRQIMGLTEGEPIQSMRQLLEKKLNIPVVEANLGMKIAGATIANGRARGIVANTSGDNENPWVRRMTLAHELAHLLWDPEQRLQRLVVDNYSDLGRRPEDDMDPVEMRANAFAVDFLAPHAAVRRIANAHKFAWSGVVALSETYGISRTAAKFHMQNVCKRLIDDDGSQPEISDDWKAREDRGNAFFPITETGESRRGRFAWVVVSALQDNLISEDTAAEYLQKDSGKLSDQERTYIKEIAS